MPVDRGEEDDKSKLFPGEDAIAAAAASTTHTRTDKPSPCSFHHLADRGSSPAGRPSL